jgi:TonB family protein
VSLDRTFVLGAVLFAGVTAGASLGCRNDQPAVRREAQNRHSDVPVAINGESPFQYPTDLYDQGIEGEVRLRLWVDSTGRVAPESTRVAAGSGTAGLDSAAMAGASQLQFAPAHQDGRPVGMVFYQPVIFRRRAAPNTPPAQ